MTTTTSQADLTGDPDLFEQRVHSLLPKRYQCDLDKISPTSMGSAEIKYDAEQRVAWDRIWTHYCDLALAGGPPHRGTLLEPPTSEEAIHEPAGYHLVTAEMARGIRLTTGLDAHPVEPPGYLAVQCPSEGMAAWLRRAVLAENVFVTRRGKELLVPAGPWFRVTKEIKNVVVSLSKTCHYWNDHFDEAERRAAVTTLLAGEAALIEPRSRPDILTHPCEYSASESHLCQLLREHSNFDLVLSQAVGWVGIRFADERTAAWFTRGAIALHVLARREEDVLYLPVSPNQAQRIETIERLRQLYAYRQRSTNENFGR